MADPHPYRPPALLAGSLGLHAASLAALALAPRHWPAVAGTLFANHVVLAAASLWPRGGLVGENLTSLPESAAERGEVCLTFDDGPDPEVTPRVLDLLESARARATFFCIGRRVEAHPGLAAEIARRGHRVENHTWAHSNRFACSLPPALRREIGRAQEAIGAATGLRPRYFRAPAGLRNPFVDWVLHGAGLRLVAWTRRGFDAVQKDPAAITRRLLHGLAPGDVLLLHDGNAFRNGGNPAVLEVLPRVLDALAARSLRCVPFYAEGESSRAAPPPGPSPQPSPILPPPDRERERLQANAEAPSSPGGGREDGRGGPGR
ncbi:MAG TPA: polysaccharide deacetylase family protein [Thermoanaerobaculia bacterium]|nr:polysaccharide deacetylase family protein [Thermoanaerobaculia bacterium]